MPFHFTALVAILLLGPVTGLLSAQIIRRWPEGRALWSGADPCPRCGRPVPTPWSRARQIGWWALLAVRDRNPCGHRPDPLRALTVLLLTIAFAALTLTHPDQSWHTWAQALLLTWLSFTLGAIDWATLTVEIRLVALGIALRFAALALFQRESLLSMGAGLLIGAGFFHMLDLFYEVFRGRRGLGEGDPAMAGLVGAFVGWEGLLAVFALASFAGLIGGATWLLVRRRPLTGAIPFSPFLGAAGLAVFLVQLHGHLAWPEWWHPVP